jgi:hypothetical protein
MMNFSTLKRRFSMLAIGAILLNPVWTATASGTNIQVGGGQRLNISRFQVVHQETFDSSQAPESIFWGALDVGKRPNDPWAGMLTKGVYALTHTGQPGEARYYFRQYLDHSADRGLSAYPLSVEVGGTMNEKISGAGLLYAYDPLKKHYLAFVKGPGKTYAIYRRNSEGLRRILGGSTDAVHPRKTNRLAIVPEGATINFYINGTQVAALKEEIPVAAGAGILAISSGMFLFDNFTIYALPQSTAPSPTSGPDGTLEKTQRPAEHEDKIPSASSPNREIANRTKSQQKMIDAYEDVLKVGMTRQQVLELFGPPNWDRNNRLVYLLSKRDFGVDLYELVIQLGDDGKVAKFREIQG